MEAVRFSELEEEDLPFVKEVYDYYTLHSTAVYFTAPVSPDEIRSSVPLHDPQYRSFLIRDRKGRRAGFCSFNRFKEKPAFRISVEVTVYLAPDCLHRGIGTAALEYLEAVIRRKGFSNAVALVDSENRASIRLFEKCGYTCAARLKEIAEKFGKKLTLNIYQKILV